MPLQKSDFGLRKTGVSEIGNTGLPNATSLTRHNIPGECGFWGCEYFDNNGPHRTRHFSKRQRLPGDCFSPLLMIILLNISTLTPATQRYVGSAQSGEVELRRQTPI